MKKALSIFDVRKWEKDTKIVGLVILGIFLVMSVLAILKPTETDMKAQASEEMQALIQADEGRAYKSVITTYNDLYFINYCSFSSQGFNAMSERYVGFAGQVFEADEGTGKFVGQMVNYTYRMLGGGRSILYGAKLTLVLTSSCMVIGLILAVFLALGKISKHKLISVPCSAYIFFFRGTPLMIQLFVIYLAIPGLVDGFSWTGLFSSNDPEAVFKGAFVAALIGFSLNNAAYCAEIVRAAIQSIDKGQYEAGKALGMNQAQIMSKVVIPQTFRRLVPPVANEFIMLLKDASIVFAIGLMDITTISKTISAQGEYLVFIPALILYLIITAFFTFLFGKIEKRFAVYE